MSKLYYTKLLLLFTVQIFIGISGLGQDRFIFQGKLMVNNKTLGGAEVIAYLDGKPFAKDSTNQVGSFSLSMSFQKIYVLHFKHHEYPLFKVLVSTKAPNIEGGYSKSKTTVFTLSSSDFDVNSPSKNDFAATFQISENGLFVESDAIISEKTLSEMNKENSKEKEIEKLKAEIEKDIDQKDKVEKEILTQKFSTTEKKIDSLLHLAYVQYGQIIHTSRNLSDDIIRNAYFKLPEILAMKSEEALSNDLALKSQLEQLQVDNKKFLADKNVQAKKNRLNEFTNKPLISKKDTLNYIQAVVHFKEEIVKSARLQREIDKLNAKTREDSIELQQREIAIHFAEVEIQEAKNKIQIQQLEIKQKNTMLFFSISALILFFIIILVVYNSFRNKKRVNQILEKQNNEIANKNKKIIDSIRYAQTIQQAILPIKSFIDKHFDCFIIYQPKDIVSGDFYWFDYFESENKRIIAVVDCTGHGVPGAFMSMIGNRLLIEVVKEKGITTPVKILDEIDASIRQALMQEETSNNDGMDICICCIEGTENDMYKVEYAGAKRPLFYSQEKTGIHYLKGTVRGIGGKKRIREKANKPFEAHTISLRKGDMLYLTTDGFFDVQSPNRKKFGRSHFMELLQNNYQKDLNAQKEALLDELHIYKGSEYQNDDITILGIRL
jgi:serine phosphatase RsbU (regulator of sigma subunit)